MIVAVVKWYNDHGEEFNALVIDTLTPNGVVYRTILTEGE